MVFQLWGVFFAAAPSDTESDRLGENSLGERLDRDLHLGLGLGIQCGQIHRHADLGMFVEHFGETDHGNPVDGIVDDALKLQHCAKHFSLLVLPARNTRAARANRGRTLVDE
jgi:hypothetical protein